jgi:hypothetical protein
MLAKVIGDTWTMPIEQQWYWQFKHEDHKRRRVEKSWYRQMPCDDYEALLGERDKIVGEETLEVLKKSQVAIEKVPAYMLAGDGVAEKHEPKEADVWYGDDSPQRLKTHFITRIRSERLDWMFVPLKRISKFDPLEKFCIFKEPEEGFDYSIGWDTGTGLRCAALVTGWTLSLTNRLPSTPPILFLWTIFTCTAVRWRHSTQSIWPQ